MMAVNLECTTCIDGVRQRTIYYSEENDDEPACGCRGSEDLFLLFELRNLCRDDQNNSSLHNNNIFEKTRCQEQQEAMIWMIDDHDQSDLVGAKHTRTPHHHEEEPQVQQPHHHHGFVSPFSPLLLALRTTTTKRRGRRKFVVF
jgi:hypothetical protein